MKHEAGDKRAIGKRQRYPANDRARLNEFQSSPDTERLDADDARFLLSALLSGKLCRPTPFAEIAEDCPEVWSRALQVFAGNKGAARNWLETRSPIFHGRRPIAVAMQIGGRRRVLQELNKLPKH